MHVQKLEVITLQDRFFYLYNFWMQVLISDHCDYEGYSFFGSSTHCPTFYLKKKNLRKILWKKTRPVQAEFQVRRWQTSIKEQCSNTLCVRATARSGQTGDAPGLSFHLYVGYELTYDYVACYCSAHWFSGYHNCGDQSMAVHGGRRWLHYQWTMLSMTRSTS